MEELRHLLLWEFLFSSRDAELNLVVLLSLVRLPSQDGEEEVMMTLCPVCLERIFKHCRKDHPEGLTVIIVGLSS